MSEPEDPELEEALGHIRAERRYIRNVLVVLLLVCGVSAFAPLKELTLRLITDTKVCDEARAAVGAHPDWLVVDLLDHETKAPLWRRAAIGRAGTSVQDDLWVQMNGTWRHLSPRCGGIDG
jgi:hypothetical protein